MSINTTIVKNERLDWIDTVKTIGIILVLLGHCQGIPGKDCIYLFHMPLFYVISGFCWNTDKYKKMPFKEFLLKKFKAYIIPYFKISFVCFVIFGVLLGLHTYGFSLEYFHKLLKYLFGICIYSRGTTEWLPNCSPIWFLTALFCAEVIFYFVMKFEKSLAVVVLCGFMGYICSLVGKQRKRTKFTLINHK